MNGVGETPANKESAHFECSEQVQKFVIVLYAALLIFGRTWLLKIPSEQIFIFKGFLVAAALVCEKTSA